MPYIAAALLFVIGSFIGLKFPDFDLAFRWHPILLHRSILTHSFLVPLLVTASLGVLRKGVAVSIRWFALGLCSATAVHLCFDLFVREWRGFARIHLPFYGWTTPLLSQMCLALSALACLVLACRLLRNGNELYLLLGGLIVSYGVSAAKQPYLSFGALVTLLIAGFIAFLIARPGYQPDENRLVRKYLEK